MLGGPMGVPSYQLLRLIARGGVAEVFEAIALGDSGFRRRVAIKRLVAPGPELRTAFIDEARILGAIHHPNVVSILGVGSVEGTLFQVLELVDGLDLEGLRQRLDAQGLVLPVELCLHIGAEVAKALDVVHRAKDADGAPLGIVHRDVTPRNILLSWEGAVKLADFGVCFAHQRATQTQVGFTKGTPAYMSPEQAAGAVLDGRADLYSLGCVLRFLVGAGPSLGAPLERLLSSLMAPDRSHRPADADQAARLLLAPTLQGSREDLPRALRAFLAPLMPQPDRKPQVIPKLAELFDFEPTGSSEGDVLSYSRVARSDRPELETTDTQPWPAQVTPGSAELRRPQPKVTLEIAALFVVVLVVSALTTLLLLRPPRKPSVEIAPLVAVRPTAVTTTVAERPAQPDPSPELRVTPPPSKGRTARRTDARPSREREPDERPIAAEGERLTLRLRNSGLRLEDLSPALRARWDAAVAAQSPDGMRALWPELEADIERRRISPGVLRRRIAGAGERLRVAADQAPAARVEALERTYFRLRQRLGEPMTEPEASQLLSELEAWEREVRALQ